MPLIVRVSFIACDRKDARVLTVLDKNMRTRCLPQMQFPVSALDDLDASIRTRLSARQSLCLSTLIQIGISVENGEICIDLLGLVGDRQHFRLSGSDWWPLFDLFPWEDWRKGRPKVITDILLPGLYRWIGSSGKTNDQRRPRTERLFAKDDTPWVSHNLSARYQYLYQAGLVPEALRDRSGASVSVRQTHVGIYGQTMRGKDRLHVARALSYLRSMMQQKPLLAEMVRDPFSLGDLQKGMENIMGIGLHTQNFRRDVMRGDLLEPSKLTPAGIGGRPARLYQWRNPDLIEFSDTPLPMPQKKFSN